MTIPIVATILRALWFMGEMIHAARHKVTPLKNRDSASLKILMAYSGYLLGNLGLGLALSNWLSVVIIVAPILAALLYRIRIEERALSESLGHEYFEYAQDTKRLIPKVY